MDTPDNSVITVPASKKEYEPHYLEFQTAIKTVSETLKGMSLANLRKLILIPFWIINILKNREKLEQPILVAPSFDSKEQKLKKLIWLDDNINPMDPRMDWLAYSPVGRNVDVIWVKSLGEFKNWIKQNGLPEAICFDYDLGDTNPTGYDCAIWLIQYCQHNQLVLPSWASQCTNPLQKAYIKRLLKSFVQEPRSI